MNRRSLFLMIVFLLPFCQARAETTKLCNITLEGAFDFSKTEEAWLCGDPESHAWKFIPVNQQKTFLKSFLQARGYHQPEFKTEGNSLTVIPGPQTELERFTVNGSPPEWNWAKKWGIKGEILNPSLLNETESWAKRQLQYYGYPCPSVKRFALLESSEILLETDPGTTHRFGNVESQGLSDLAPEVLERYTAFVPGQLFDIRLLELTSDRILRDDLYLSTYYDINCRDGDLVRVQRRFVPALPRLFTVGAGFDSERGPILRVRFKRVRIGHSAHSFESTLFASLREQSIGSLFRYYFLDDLSSRLHLAPNFQFDRQDEDRFVTLSLEAGLPLANSWESEVFRLDAESGPMFDWTKIIRGQGPDILQLIKWKNKITATDHLYEYYLSDPRTGWTFDLEAVSQFAGLVSEQTLHRLLFSHQVLWNLGRWDPPFLILGWRGYAGSYIFGDRPLVNLAIPPDEKFFLGGDSSIRGFGRKELPGDANGFLTAIYQGLELRTGGWFPLNLQPFLFFDLVKGGKAPLELKNTIYYAPGFGLRYESPIGTIRASLGRGFVANKDLGDPEPHFQFFFSLGREF